MACLAPAFFFSIQGDPIIFILEAKDRYDICWIALIHACSNGFYNI